MKNAARLTLVLAALVLAALPLALAADAPRPSAPGTSSPRPRTARCRPCSRSSASRAASRPSRARRGCSATVTDEKLEGDVFSEGPVRRRRLRRRGEDRRRHPRGHLAGRRGLRHAEGQAPAVASLWTSWTHRSTRERGPAPPDLRGREPGAASAPTSRRSRPTSRRRGSWRSSRRTPTATASRRWRAASPRRPTPSAWPSSRRASRSAGSGSRTRSSSWAGSGRARSRSSSSTTSPSPCPRSPGSRDVEEAAAARGARARVHLKIDTGMERIGVHYYNAEGLLEAAARSPHVRGRGDLLALRQRRRRGPRRTRGCSSSASTRCCASTSAARCPSPLRHIANSAALLRLPEAPPRHGAPGHPALRRLPLRGRAARGRGEAGARRGARASSTSRSSRRAAPSATARPGRATTACAW